MATIEAKRSFLADVHPLRTTEERTHFDDAPTKRAFLRVFNGLITNIPGKQWATTPEVLEKHDLAGGSAM
jgi:hypothetical protein